MSKPVIDTIINTSALALTSYGVLQITAFDEILRGVIALTIGMSLEFIKYYWRKKKLW